MNKHRHHIIPKHMGGSNDPSNIIELTVEEHAEAHRILYELYDKEEDRLAWLGLSKQISKLELLAEIRKSDEYKQKHKAAVTSEEYRNKMSKKFSGENHPMFNKKHSSESIEKIKKSRSSQIFSKESIQKRTEKLYKSLQTPHGLFSSRKEASEHYNVDPSTLNYWMKIKPNEYYYKKELNDE